MPLSRYFRGCPRAGESVLARAANASGSGEERSRSGNGPGRLADFCLSRAGPPAGARPAGTRRPSIDAFGESSGRPSSTCACHVEADFGEDFQC